MSKLEILTYPNKFLSKPTRELDNIDGEVQEMIELMSTAMYEAPDISSIIS